MVTIHAIGKTYRAKNWKSMEVHQLRYFCAVAETGNFTRAAQQEHVAQPSLSQQILKLEDELGARLFDRLPKSARLTGFGRAFLPKARNILRQLGEAKTEIHEMAGLVRGEITVGVIPTIAPYLLPAVLSSFSREHPGITINVAEEVTSVLLERLHAGAIDLAVLTLPVPGTNLSVSGCLTRLSTQRCLQATGSRFALQWDCRKSRANRFCCSRKVTVFATMPSRPVAAPALHLTSPLKAGNLPPYWQWFRLEWESRLCRKWRYSALKAAVSCGSKASATAARSVQSG